MKRILLLTVVLLYFVTVYGISKADSTRLPIDTSVIAIMPPNFLSIFLDKHSTATLTSKDCRIIEKMLKVCMSDYNIKQQKYADESDAKFDRKIERSRLMMYLEESKRQYIVGINKNGEKDVYINCFNAKMYNKDYGNWKKKFILIMAGGNSCF